MRRSEGPTPEAFAVPLAVTPINRPHVGPLRHATRSLTVAFGAKRTFGGRSPQRIYEFAAKEATFELTYGPVIDDAQATDAEHNSDRGDGHVVARVTCYLIRTEYHADAKADGGSCGFARINRKSFGEAAGEQWSDLTVGEDDKWKLAEAGRQVLQLFPGRIPYACCLMSAAYSVMLEHVGTKPAYVVAGSLYAGDTRIFGEEGEFDGKACFCETNMSWDGHAWIVYGDWLADVSLFRTADSDQSPPALKDHVKRQFGHGKGLYVCRLGSEAENGFRYEPRYVLTLDQVNGLAQGANLLINATGSE